MHQAKKRRKKQSGTSGGSFSTAELRDIFRIDETTACETADRLRQEGRLGGSAAAISSWGAVESFADVRGVLAAEDPLQAGNARIKNVGKYQLCMLSELHVHQFLGAARAS